MVDYRIGMQANNQIVPLGSSLLQEVQVANVKQVKSTGNVYNPVSWLEEKKSEHVLRTAHYSQGNFKVVCTNYLGFFALAELNDFLSGRQKLRHASPRRTSVRALTH